MLGFSSAFIVGGVYALPHLGETTFRSVLLGTFFLFGLANLFIRKVYLDSDWFGYLFAHAIAGMGGIRIVMKGIENGFFVEGAQDRFGTSHLVLDYEIVTIVLTLLISVLFFAIACSEGEFYQFSLFRRKTGGLSSIINFAVFAVFCVALLILYFNQSCNRFFLEANLLGIYLSLLATQFIFWSMTFARGLPESVKRSIEADN